MAYETIEEALSAASQGQLMDYLSDSSRLQVISEATSHQLLDHIDDSELLTACVERHSLRDVLEEFSADVSDLFEYIGGQSEVYDSMLNTYFNGRASTMIDEMCTEVAYEMMYDQIIGNYDIWESIASSDIIERVYDWDLLKDIVVAEDFSESFNGCSKNYSDIFFEILKTAEDKSWIRQTLLMAQSCRAPSVLPLSNEP